MKENEYTSYLIENKIKKRALMFIVFVSWLTFTVFTSKQMNEGHDWMQIGLTLSAFSSLLILYPLTERWRYKPWQNKATKMEYTFLK